MIAGVELTVTFKLPNPLQVPWLPFTVSVKTPEHADFTFTWTIASVFVEGATLAKALPDVIVHECPEVIAGAEKVRLELGHAGI